MTGERTEFTLYEDDGEDLGYLRGEFLKTPVCFTSEEDQYVLEIGDREGQGYEVPGERELIFKIYAGRVPKTVIIDGVKAKKNKVWSVDKKEAVSTLAITDDGKSHYIRFIF